MGMLTELDTVLPSQADLPQIRGSGSPQFCKVADSVESSGWTPWKLAGLQSCIKSLFRTLVDILVASSLTSAIDESD